MSHKLMFKNFVIFALLLVASCEVEEIRICGCEVTFSDALPVQFWLSNCETFNEKEVDGIFSKCFCQLFNSADEITIQFKDTPGYSRTLLAVDSDNEIVFELSFNEVSPGVYSQAFTPASQGVTNDEFKLQVIEASSALRIIAPSLWTDGTGSFDTKNATQLGESVTSATNSVSAYQGLVIPAGTIISFEVTVTVTGTWTFSGSSPIIVVAYLSDNTGTALNVDNTEDTNVFSANGTYTIKYIMEVPSDISTIERLYIKLDEIGVSSGTAIVNITLPVNQILYVSPESILAKSDCISIKEDHDETILINYHNNRIFASLNSSVGTPDPEFNLRLPAIFSESDERTPRESESVDLSDSTSLQVMAQIKKQRLFKIKHIPPYLHTKTVLALSFQTVTIDGKLWKLDESYERDRGRATFPLKTAQCWLTERNYLLRNVL